MVEKRNQRGRNRLDETDLTDSPQPFRAGLILRDEKNIASTIYGLPLANNNR
jgi:hypothetical protein